MKTRRAQLGFVTAAGLLTSLCLLSSCGGGGTTPAPSPPPPPPLTITTESLAEGYLGESYTQLLRASGGKLPYTWTVAGSSQLPPGLNIVFDVAWRITGVPTELGTFSFTLQVKDAQSRTATGDFTMRVVERLRVTTTTLPKAVSGQPYTYALEATGGTPPYSWSVVSSLPQDLTMDSTGIISGTPMGIIYAWNLRVQVKDAESRTAEGAFNFRAVDPLKITTNTLPNSNVGVAYSASLYATGGQYPLQWSLSPNSTLPAGISFSSEGRLSGTPTEPGTFELEVEVSDTGFPTLTDRTTLSLFIDNRPVIVTQSLPSIVVTESYAHTIQAVGGTLPYTWAITQANPTGIFSIDSSTGELTGTPTEARTHSVTVQVTDASTPPQTASRQFYIYVLPLPHFITSTLPDGIRSASYYGYISVEGGRAPYTVRAIAGVLPTGLSLPSATVAVTFLIRGTPAELGVFNFTLELADSSSPPYTATRDFSIRINEPLAITTTSLPEGWSGDPYSATLTATGGVLPHTWRAESALPPNLGLNASTGEISGIPTEGFNGSIYVSVQDTSNPPQRQYKSLPLRIIGRLLITTTRLPAARPSAYYQAVLGLTGGTAPYTWSISSGKLPAGLSLYSASGLIYGTPTREETQTFTVQATDSGPPVQTVTRELTIQITNSLGRNDTVATATPLSNGTFRASISPYADPVLGPANPDHDYYALTADPGAVVTVETQAKRLVPKSPLDSVIEIVDWEGTRFTTCRNEGRSDGLRAGTYDPTPTAFDDVCVNDDIEIGVIQDSKLEFEVPGTPGTPVTFYVRVLDWGGNARPDFVYDLVIKGAH